MAEILSYQKENYDFPIIPKIYSFLQNLDVFNENTLFSLSLKYEQKETKFINPLHRERKSSLGRRSSFDKNNNEKSKKNDEDNNNQNNNNNNNNNNLLKQQEPINEINENTSFDNENNGNYNEILDEKLKEDDFSSLEVILSNSVTYKIFEEYLEKNNVKNLLDFLKDVEILQEIEDPKMISKKASEIFQNYFKENKVQMDEDIKIQIQQKSNFNILSKDSFNLAESFVINLLSQTYFPSFLTHLPTILKKDY
jgi:hypothetical protein